MQPRLHNARQCQRTMLLLPAVCTCVCDPCLYASVQAELASHTVGCRGARCVTHSLSKARSI